MDIKTQNQIIEETKKFEDIDYKKYRIWFTSYIAIAVFCFIIYFLLRFKVFNILGSYRLLLQHLALACFFVFIVLIVTKGVELLIVRNPASRVVNYNLVRLIRLLSVVLAVFIIISFLFENWYTAAVSLGLISIVLGFALQTPISSFIGWIYLVIRTPYKVGDRIQIGNFTGDVVEISYFDTTLWEFGGAYQTNDLPSGRLIRFPNTLVFGSPVYNYSWKKFPYIWNEIPFHIAYESDLVYVETTMREVARIILGPKMEENIRMFKAIVEETPVDELEIKEYPFVTFRTNINSWVEALLIYLVPPKRASAVRSQLIKAVVKELLKEPAKVMFPRSNIR